MFSGRKLSQGAPSGQGGSETGDRRVNGGGAQDGKSSIKNVFVFVF